MYSMVWVYFIVLLIVESLLLIIIINGILYINKKLKMLN